MNFYFNWSPDWTEFIDVEYYTFKYQLLIINIFYILLYSLILLLITRNSLFIVWLIMEAIVFFTIPIILSFKKESINSESVVIYFIYQAIASILIISGIIRNYININSYLFIAGVFVKLGIFPFHLWVLPVLSGCSHLIIFTLLIPVKLPIYMLRNRKRNLIITVFL